MTRSLPILGSSFDKPQRYMSSSGSYSLLPFRFLALDERRHVLTNLVGEHLVVEKGAVHAIIKHTLSTSSPVYDELKSRHFLVDDDSTVALDLLSVKYRTKQARLSELTSLFMFVATLRCEHTCRYCQVSRVTEDRAQFDMTPTIADRGLDLVFASPSKTIKIEFQGGEPLLNFDIIRYVVEAARRRNQTAGKDLAFVVTSNLALLSDLHLAFFKENDVFLSTSLDGPAALHNENRKRPGGDSHERALQGITSARAVLGHDHVSALMTTSPMSLDQPEAIIDEYVRVGFDSIFLRSISPYGFAAKSGAASTYGSKDWHTFYRRALRYILSLNERGVLFREEFTTLLLRRMLTSFPTGYVDLQSPAGAGIAALVVNYDGDVYASDEARMLAEMGDKTFKLGNVFQHSFAELVGSDALLEPLLASMTEGAPMCSDCAFQPWCGADPVFHHATQGDAVGFKPASAFCDKHMSAFRYLVSELEDNPAAARVLRSWL